MTLLKDEISVDEINSVTEKFHKQWVSFIKASETIAYGNQSELFPHSRAPLTIPKGHFHGLKRAFFQNTFGGPGLFIIWNKLK